ncbi:MAG: LON peptidase substrate-binding domain-containing protein [Oscillospiraceae bacterium]
MREKRMVTQNQTLPMIALRGLVLFPKMVLHFDIGRDKSIAALNAAGENGRKVFLSAQRELADDDPAPKELYPVGVIAEIKQVIRVPACG